MRRQLLKSVEQIEFRYRVKRAAKRRAVASRSAGVEQYRRTQVQEAVSATRLGNRETEERAGKGMQERKKRKEHGCCSTTAITMHLMELLGIRKSIRGAVFLASL